MKFTSAVIIVLSTLAPFCFAGEGSWGDSSHGIRCSLAAKSFQWVKGTSAPVTVTIENVSSEPIKIKVITSFELGDMQYWAPVKLAAASEHLPANTKYEITLRPRQRQEFEVDLSKLKWEKSISSIWPHRDLFEVVPSGKYKLSFGIELRTKDTSKRIYSNRVDVSVL